MRERERDFIHYCLLLGIIKKSGTRREKRHVVLHGTRQLELMEGRIREERRLHRLLLGINKKKGVGEKASSATQNNKKARIKGGIREREWTAKNK